MCYNYCVHVYIIHNSCNYYYYSRLNSDKELQDIQDQGDKSPDDSVSSDDDFFDAEDVPHIPTPVVTTPSLAVPIGEDGPSDIEDGEEYNEQDDISSK